MEVISNLVWSRHLVNDEKVEIEFLRIDLYNIQQNNSMRLLNEHAQNNVVDVCLQKGCDVHDNEIKLLSTKSTICKNIALIILLIVDEKAKVFGPTFDMDTGFGCHFVDDIGWGQLT